MNCHSPKFADPADRSEASYSRHPMEDMEPDTAAEDEFAIAQEYLARLWVWQTSGGTLKSLCQRATVICLLMREDLMGGMTLEKLGQFFGVSRADMDKLAIDFRRTFHTKGRNQKANNTRKRCRQSQIAHHRQRQLQ
jgi:hypothetical protein